MNFQNSVASISQKAGDTEGITFTGRTLAEKGRHHGNSSNGGKTDITDTTLLLILKQLAILPHQDVQHTHIYQSKMKAQYYPSSKILRSLAYTFIQETAGDEPRNP